VASKQQMLINYVPGEECRVAVMKDDRLEEIHAERLNAVSHVGNIYVGKVVNVESAIQAAFIDFGLEQNGFLHISDLHPRYFPGGKNDTTEKVGKKTPRRERPPIQECLKRGQEITVQVLKEGIGTKGPTLTSYLSIPGRYLVMMPDMDKVGVSRKVEDDDTRKKMRQALDQLDLPDGFGFILRTAGMDRPKSELKRDLSYLQRLWKDMERRRKGKKGPRLLYAESDLLVRALRDLLTSEFQSVVIDNDAALERAGRFMKIVAPRSSVKLLRYDEPTPIYHAFGVEEQIKRIYSRTVPLPSGGSLVIDEAEALVAIDVNSGKMRSHGDAETTAYKTDIEAVDEICRQLRLRDLGGLVICDLIDMRSRSHRRDIEARFRAKLKEDRARSKTLPISQFGIVEMTRQRMRGSVRSGHFGRCPHCDGRGHVQRPDSVANDALRDLASLLVHDRVHRVEMVVSPRVAGHLLSTKRRRLNMLELSTKKQLDVRVSESISVDRVDFYAYDDRGADVDISRLPQPRAPKSLPEWMSKKTAKDADWAVDPTVEAAETAEELAAVHAEMDEESIEPLDDEQEAREKREQEQREGEGEGEGEGRGRRRRRRGGRGRRGRGGRERESDTETRGKEERGTREERPEKERAELDQEGEKSDEGGRGRRRRRRGRRGRGGRDRAESGQRGSEESGASGSQKATEETSESSDGESQREPAPRGDSWDLEPSEVRSKRSESRNKKPSSNGQAQRDERDKRDESEEERQIAASGFPPRGDSWDLEPAAIPAKQQKSGSGEDTAPEPQAKAEKPDDKGAKPRRAPRGRKKSPKKSESAKPAAGGDEAPAPKKPSRRKKSTRKAAAEKPSAKDDSAAKTSKKKSSRKKSSIRKKKASGAKRDEPKAEASKG